MKYWAIHTTLAGILIAIWIPTFVSNNAEEAIPTDAAEQMEALPPEPIITDDSDSLYYYDRFLGPPESAAPENDVSAVRSHTNSIWSDILGSLKELASVIVLFGNVITFFWQWKDRRKKNTDG